MISAILDGTHSDEADHCSRDAAGVSKLPQINGEFWELFLKPSPHWFWDFDLENFHVYRELRCDHEAKMLA